MNHNTGITTLGKAAERSAYLAAECYDEFVPVADISFPDGLESVSIAGERRPLRENAQRQIANRLNVPFPFLQRCPTDLQTEILTCFLTKERNDNLFYRFDGVHVRALFTPRYFPVSNLDIINRLFTLGYGYNTPVQARLDASFMSISIPDSKMTFDLDGNGDCVNPGLCFANSEVGLSAVHITAYMLRLVCTNGMLAKTSASASKRHISSTILDDFPMMAESANRQLAAMTHQFKLSIASPVEDPEATFAALNRQFLVTEDEVKAVEWASLHEGPVRTIFNVANSYTRAPQFPGLSAHSCHKLERVGGQVLSTIRQEAA